MTIAENVIFFPVIGCTRILILTQSMETNRQELESMPAAAGPPKAKKAAWSKVLLTSADFEDINGNQHVCSCSVECSAPN